jgi:hypothetical protein
MMRLIGLWAVFLVVLASGCTREKAAPVSAQELAGTYVARTKEMGRERKGSIRLEPDGTYVHRFEVDGAPREQTGTWVAIEDAAGTRVQLNGFVAEWLSMSPTLWQTPAQRYGEGVALVADSDLGFYFVKSAP